MIGTTRMQTTASSPHFGPTERKSGNAKRTPATERSAMVAGHRGSSCRDGLSMTTFVSALLAGFCGDDFYLNKKLRTNKLRHDQEHGCWGGIPQKGGAYLRISGDIFGAREILRNLDHIGQSHLRLFQHPQYMFPGNLALARDIVLQPAVGLQPRCTRGKKPTYVGTN